MLCALLSAGCKAVPDPDPSSDPSEEPSAEPSSDPSDDPSSGPVQIEPLILTFSIRECPDAEISISQDKTISAIVPRSVSLSALTVDFTMPEGVTATPESGSVLDLGKKQNIFLTAPSGKAAKYTVEASLAPYSGCSLLQIQCNETLTHLYVRGSGVTIKVPYGSDLSSLTFTTVLSEGATGEASPVGPDGHFTYTVTAQDGIHKNEYDVALSMWPQDKGVRGVYLPDPSHTASFLSPEAVKNSIALLKELKFNCLYVCGWARSMVAWDSDVLLSHSTYSTAGQGNFYSGYSGEDALADIIREAHEAGIKVILWMEYGFMHRAGGVVWDDPVLAANPSWIGRGKDGDVASYNGTDFYYNAYDPEVRSFMLELMEEVLDKYPDLDGIQGDDRLPAMPRESGYNASTVELYCSQTGNPAPTDDYDRDWSRWRLDILNGFAADMATLARSRGRLISFAPNKYPWCESVLMQEWPQWVKAGGVDILNVQLYITGRYDDDLTDTVPYAEGTVFSPSMILKNGSAIMDPLMISDEWYANRAAGTGCESQFWFDGLLEEKVQDIFSKIYVEEALWPF